MTTKTTPGVEPAGRTPSARRKAELRAFQREAKPHHCWRCKAQPVVARFAMEVAFDECVLPADERWLCRRCSDAIGGYLAEVAALRRELEGPLLKAELQAKRQELEAELAPRRKALQEKQAAARERIAATRVAKGPPSDHPGAEPR